MDFDLNGKIIVVTGASSGIGRAIAENISLNGGTVIAIGRNKERLAETQKLMHSREKHIMLNVDLTNDLAVTEVVAKLPKIDGIVHSAGIIKILPAKFITQAHLAEIQKINYEVPVLLTQQLIKVKKFNKQSSIVFITSIVAQVGSKGHALYAGTKGALTAVSKVLALELASQGIRSNCILPGMIRTPMANLTGEIISAESMEDHEKMYPLGFGEPTDVALAAQFLLSNASRWITGTNLIVDGGYSSQ